MMTTTTTTQLLLMLLIVLLLTPPQRSCILFSSGWILKALSRKPASAMIVLFRLLLPLPTLMPLVLVVSALQLQLLAPPTPTAIVCIGEIFSFCYYDNVCCHYHHHTTTTQQVVSIGTTSDLSLQDRFIKVLGRQKVRNDLGS